MSGLTRHTERFFTPDGAEWDIWFSPDESCFVAARVDQSHLDRPECHTHTTSIVALRRIIARLHHEGVAK